MIIPIAILKPTHIQKKARVLSAASDQQLIKEKVEERARKEQATIDRELKRTAKKNKRNTKDPLKYFKKVGITLSEQNQCDPGSSTTNTGFSKGEKTKNVELNVKKPAKTKYKKFMERLLCSVR